jgi:hypothetical protein
MIDQTVGYEGGRVRVALQAIRQEICRIAKGDPLLLFRSIRGIT